MHVLRDDRTPHGQPRVGAVGRKIQRDDLAAFFDDPGEHAHPFRCVMIRRPPCDRLTP